MKLYHIMSSDIISYQIRRPLCGLQAREKILEILDLGSGASGRSLPVGGITSSRIPRGGSQIQFHPTWGISDPGSSSRNDLSEDVF